MINMKRPANRPQEASLASPYEGEEYPYGLCLCLDDEALQKLGITTLPEVGKEMTLTARVVVKTTMERSEADGEKCRSVELQITDMALDGPPKADQASRMYGGNS
jgi:hypothetical protein